MGKPPAAIIIARHGARLDAADKNWHLTSPTPYDPPLSYGGWLQSRALGTRIVDIIQSLGGSLDSTTPSENGVKPSNPLQKPKPKRRIIIHTSPFTRCLQTAIAVSSGIFQNSGEPDSIPSKGSTIVQSNSESALTPGPIPSSDHRCLLRVDAFLGEWLCPDYFDEIIPPPKSDRMISAAKLELLRREHSFVPPADTGPRPSTGFFPGGWGSASTPVSPANEPTGAVKAAPPTRQTGQRSRAGSCDALSSAETTRGRRILSRINTNLPSIPDAAYVPPTPSYAISPSDPIPAGYVTHARDACVKIDFQWDSMHGDQDWGDGGEYGEEWSTMHKRFRTGLDRMITWYQDHDPSIPSGRPRRHSQTLDGSEEASPHNDAEDATETILIVITHGAGCNALIGAISGEPALVNIGTASLTLAVRDDRLPETADGGSVGGPVQARGSDESSLAGYSMKLVASTDHLHVSNSTSRVSSPSQVTSPSMPSYRRMVTRPSLSQGLFIIGPSSTSGPTTVPTTEPWNAERPSTAVASKSPGLWGSMAEPTDEIVPNFDWPAPPAVNGDSQASTSKTDDSTWAKHLPQRTLSQRGLWSRGGLSERDMGHKRRWTVTERRP
ncbi:phosphoglycerate mutase family protein [Aspergillus sclerotiicarbonarius CBS 121057]|uniref:Phosphoglycerate mutase family protein n=1 Tax=Aspergillus sclerotiicarbonarius (strain CBS 121057 / IBT 28362) TaxID=1448318 RepID=A0A319F1W6_ASPSB|nr:phosphoglycerate mutase family protein [Aspergillus sclerotiicarbonarius CBS 121057]